MYTVMFPEHYDHKRCQKCGNWAIFNMFKCGCIKPRECLVFDNMFDAQEFIKDSELVWDNQTAPEIIKDGDLCES